MRYIRLKDKIVKVDTEDSECYYFNKLKKFVYKDEGYKTADTIEELCDEFVLYYLECKDKCNIPWATYERRGVWEKEREHIIKEIVSHPSYRQPVLYGAIWTDKGLKYVAKINKEGELELI